MKKQFNPNYFGSPDLERKFNENHGADGKFTGSDGGGTGSTAPDYAAISDQARSHGGRIRNEANAGERAVNRAKAATAAGNHQDAGNEHGAAAASYKDVSRRAAAVGNTKLASMAKSAHLFHANAMLQSYVQHGKSLS